MMGVRTNVKEGGVDGGERGKEGWDGWELWESNE